jgi:hypothetical protein
MRDNYSRKPLSYKEILNDKSKEEIYYNFFRFNRYEIPFEVKQEDYVLQEKVITFVAECEKIPESIESAENYYKLQQL